MSINLAFLIGTDEAGYGPNLGPLVIGGTRWSVPTVETNLDDCLQEAICRERIKSKSEFALRPLLMADSKEVYKAGKIKELELGVLSVFAAMHQKLPSDLRRFMKVVCGPSCTNQHFKEFWLAGSPLKLPVAADKTIVLQQAERLRSVFQRTNVTIDRLEAKLVFPQRFNDQIEQVGNKATLLSGETLSLVKDLIEGQDSNDHLMIRCDKHGGRNTYVSLLQHFVTDRPVKIETESKQLSRYRWSDSTIEFIPKGESHLPIALSSMIAKYLRELMMMAWNEFWQIEIPNLRPTKGYPQDAKRFKKDIESAQRKLKIADDQIWRRR